MILRRTCLLCCVFLLFACGYRMAGVGTQDTVTYHISAVYNQSKNLRIDKDIDNAVRRYFYDHGLVKPLSEADYVLRVSLTEYSVEDESLSISREAISSVIYAVYNFHVTDKTGRVLYERDYRRSETFSVGASITQYRRNVGEAFTKLTDDILSEFTYAFQISR